MGCKKGREDRGILSREKNGMCWWKGNERITKK